MRLLLVAFAFVLPYHVLRTASAAGMAVHVLGNGPARGLKWSRYCASYRQSRFGGGGEPDDLILDEIRSVVRRHRIDSIVPADDVSTRLIAALQGRLPAPTSLIPDLASFDLLNDKWNFTRYCLEHGVRVPQGWLYQDLAALRAAIDRGVLRLPITAKPTTRSGGTGVVHLVEERDLALLDAIDYQPILIQRHITGETIGISVVCRRGEILSHATQRRDDRRFQLFQNPDLLSNVERLVAATAYNGPANFDVVLEDATGLNYIVECNPRFWYTIYMSMIVGINFVDAAVRNKRWPAIAAGEVQLSLAHILRRPGQSTPLDWKMMRYRFSDPVPYWFQRKRMFDDRGVYVRPAQMTAYHAVEPVQPVAGWDADGTVADTAEAMLR